MKTYKNIENMNIQEYRIKKKLTQDQLAKLLGVSNVTVSKWETNLVKPTKKHLEKLEKLTLKQPLEAIPFRPIQYLGSKLKLLENIDELINNVCEKNRVCDLFSGSGVVSNYISHSSEVISCDVQNYSAHLASALLRKSSFENEKFDLLLKDVANELKTLPPKILELIEYEASVLNLATDGKYERIINFSNNASLYINSVNPIQLSNEYTDFKELLNNVIGLESLKNYQILYLYGGVYFSYKQAIEIDLLRQLIEKKITDEDSKSLLIASILSATSDIVNTVGKQFAQPTKLLDRDGKVKKLQLSRTIKNKSYNLLDKVCSAFYSFKKAQNTIKFNNNEVICSDVFDFLVNYQGEISCFYADPPYTIDHYSRFYHVLETISLYDNPSLAMMNKKGSKEVMNGLYRLERHQSEFCVPSLAPKAFDKLFAYCRKFNAPIVLSYSPFDKSNNERSRLLTKDELESIAKKYYGKVTFYESKEHKHRKLHSKNNNLKEIQKAELFIICEVE